MIDKSIKGYFDKEGRIKQLPGRKQKTKLDLLIEYLVEQFVSDRIYSEQEVNAVLNAHHSFNDPATLRRLLFGTRKMDRTKDGRQYWLI